MTTKRRPGLALPLIAFLVGPVDGGGLAGQAVATVFVDVSIVDVEALQVKTMQTLVVQGGLIAAMGSSETTEVPPDAVRLDAAGQYLIPGLIEVSGQIPSPGDGNSAIDALINYMAQGMTTVRLPEGDPTVAALRAQIESGGVLAPRIVLAEPLLRGSSEVGPNVRGPETPGEA